MLSLLGEQERAHLVVQPCILYVCLYVRAKIIHKYIITVIFMNIAHTHNVIATCLPLGSV